MASFDRALAYALKNEGFYGIDKDDSGGETIWGIARKKNPHWGGWAVVEQNRNRSNFPDCLKSNTMLLGMRAEFYRNEYWKVIKGDSIINEDVATDLFDRSINQGCHQAISLCQRSLGHVESGVMDSSTLAKINEWNPYA